MVSNIFQSRSTAVYLHAKLQYANLYVKVYKAQWTGGTINDGGCSYNISQVKTNSSWRRTVCTKVQHLFGTLQAAHATEMFVCQVHIVCNWNHSTRTHTDYGTPLRLTKRHSMYCVKLDEIKGKQIVNQKKKCHQTFVWHSASRVCNWDVCQAGAYCVQLKPISQETQTDYGTWRQKGKTCIVDVIQGKPNWRAKVEMSSTLSLYFWWCGTGIIVIITIT